MITYIFCINNFAYNLAKNKQKPSELVYGDNGWGLPANFLMSGKDWAIVIFKIVS